MSIVFVYYHKYEEFWKDGLYGAVKLLEKNHDVVWHNLYKKPKLTVKRKDFVLGWGAFYSPVDNAIKDLPNKKALCIGGVTIEPDHSLNYDVLFCETEWYKKQLAHPITIKAFGINTDIYKTITTKIFYDYLSVGAFADWKRHEMLINKPGRKLVIGEVQEDNLEESMRIIQTLVTNGVMVSPMINPERLADYYLMSANVYIPATLFGGGERAVLEARACGCDVIVENDNPKLKELLYGPIYSHIDYAKELERGISCCQ